MKRKANAHVDDRTKSVLASKPDQIFSYGTTNDIRCIQSVYLQTSIRKILKEIKSKRKPPLLNLWMNVSMDIFLNESIPSSKIEDNTLTHERGG